MKAAIITGYGLANKVKVREAPKPSPRAGEVLIRVHAATVNRTDCGELRPHPFFARLFFGLLRPKREILGLDFAGEIEAAGTGVDAFKPGERVFGMCPSRNNGAQAEYVCVPQDGPIAAMPPDARFEEWVVCEGAFYANTTLTRFKVGPSHKVLIYGASGAIGSAAVQLAKFHGAEIVAVVAARHVELAKSLGAGRVIDYTVEDYTQIDDRFDLIFDAVGKASFYRCRKLLKPDGAFAVTDFGPWWQNIPLFIWSAVTANNRVVLPIPAEGSGRAFVVFLKERMQAGQFRAVIDRSYPLDAIAEAYRYVEAGQKAGIVVINVTPPA